MQSTTLAVREAPKERNPPKELNEALREMNRTVKGLEKRLDKRIASFPAGEYAFLTRCMVQDNRTGVVRQHLCVVGSGILKDAVDKHWDDIINYVPQEEESEEEDVDAKAIEYLNMPSSANPRAAKLREMLRLLWNLEGLSNTKQIYNAVAKGEAGFDWWSTEFPDIPFTNKAVEASNDSARIYRVVAPKLYEKLTGRIAPAAAPEPPFVRCDRSHHITGLQQCTLKRNHAGLCNMQYIPQVISHAEEHMEVEVEEEEEEEEEEQQHTNRREFYSAIKSVCHKKEPSLKFTTGDIKKLSVIINDGHDHLTAYRRMGLSISKRYVEWYENSYGKIVWKEIKTMFPDYLEDYVLDPRKAIREHFHGVVPKKTEKEIKKTKKKLKKAIRRAIKNLPGRRRY